MTLPTLSGPDYFPSLPARVVSTGRLPLSGPWRAGSPMRAGAGADTALHQGSCIVLQPGNEAASKPFYMV